MNLYTRLINKDHPLPPDYVPENLTDIGIPFDAPCGDSKRLLEIRTAHAVLTLIQEAQKESLVITGVSGYRSYKRQQKLSTGNPYIAAPGTSEHQSGLALDVSCHYPLPCKQRIRHRYPLGTLAYPLCNPSTCRVPHTDRTYS